VYNDKNAKKSDTSKFSAFGGLDSLLSITEMPSGSPVVSVGVNKSANAAIYTMKILANEFPDLQKKLKTHKSDQHDSVIKESDELKKQGLSKFAKNKFKWQISLVNNLVYCLYMVLSKRPIVKNI